jgi:hypothetical protein
MSSRGCTGPPSATAAAILPPSACGITLMVGTQFQPTPDMDETLPGLWVIYHLRIVAVVVLK